MRLELRMQADLALIRIPAAQRRNYRNAFQALYRITADEGVLALWKGAGPTVVRAIALNMGMLASYDQSVEFFKDNLGFGEAATILGKISCIVLTWRRYTTDINFTLSSDLKKCGCGILWT
ncbi:putative mitochondrial carrier domain superfamily [Helianthus anomalus]